MTLAEAFFHLARVEERNGARDEHDRFRASSSCLDPLDPPLERLRRRLGVEPPRWGGARFAVALTHDVDTPWKWTRIGAQGRRRAREARPASAGGSARRCASCAGSRARRVHKARGTDPYWSFDRILADERRCGASSTFFLMADHAHELDGAAPASRTSGSGPRLVETLLEGGAEVGLHGSYSAADDPARIADEKAAARGARRAGAGASGTTSSGSTRTAISASSRRPASRTTRRSASATRSASGPASRIRSVPGISSARRRAQLVEVPLAAMDVTLSAERYLGLSADEAERAAAWRSSTGRPRTAAASPSSGTPSSTTRPCCPGGTGCTGG